MQKLILTEKGKEIIARLILEESTMNFTKIVLSDFDYSNSDLEKLTSLKNIKQTSLISSISKVDASTIKIIANIDNSTLEDNYYVRTLGLYAKENDIEFLFGISIELDNPDYMLAYNGRNVMCLSYTINVKVDNANQIIMEVNPSAYPTNEQVEQKISDSRPKSYIATLSKENWILNEENNLYEYTIDNVSITENTYVEVCYDLVNKSKMSDDEIESYNGYFVIRTTELPSEDVDITYVCSLTVPQESEVEEDVGEE